MTGRIINYGSINIDYVYQVPHFVAPGETLQSQELSTGLGGKGANQSVAIAQAGGKVEHVGQLSKSDQWAVDKLHELGVGVEHIGLTDQPSGHAIIQVDSFGENAIVLHGGANQTNSLSALARVLDSYQDSEYLLLQNECNDINSAIMLAFERGIKIALNPAPMSAEINSELLVKLDTLIVNQGEAAQLSGETELDNIAKRLYQLAPGVRIVITLGGEGALLIDNGKFSQFRSPAVNVIDTTGAGDTFVGYLLTLLTEGMSNAKAVELACRAAAKAVTKAGAIDSIPSRTEL